MWLPPSCALLGSTSRTPMLWAVAIHRKPLAVCSKPSRAALRATARRSSPRACGKRAMALLPRLVMHVKPLTLQCYARLRQKHASPTHGCEVTASQKSWYVEHASGTKTHLSKS